MKIDFTRLREYGNSVQRVNISATKATIEIADKDTPDQLRSIKIGFAIRLLGYVLYGEGLEALVRRFNLITDDDEETIRIVVSNLLRLVRRLSSG